MKYINLLPDELNISYTKKRGAEQQVRCKIDPLSTNALVVGLFRPTIVMPGLLLTEKERQMIIKHEISHIRSGDILIKFFIELVCILYWWIPFVVLLKRQITSTLEMRADNDTIKGLNERERVEYLECMLKIAISSHQNSTALSVGLTNPKTTYGNKAAPLLTLFVLIFVMISILSTTIVFEPYAILEYVKNESFDLEKPTTFLVRRDDLGYDLYTEDVRVGRIEEIPETFLEFPIFDDLEDVGK